MYLPSCPCWGNLIRYHEQAQRYTNREMLYRVYVLSFTPSCHTNIVHVLWVVNVKPSRVVTLCGNFESWVWGVQPSDSATLWIVALQASLSLGFYRQEYWSGLPFPSLGDLPHPGIKLRSLALQEDSLSSEPPGKPGSWVVILYATLLHSFPFLNFRVKSMVRKKTITFHWKSLLPKWDQYSRTLLS